jgi:hypothetical protein
MKKLFICLALVSLSSSALKAKSLPGDSAKAAFYSAFEELKDMLEGKKALNYEKAVFVTENAYYNNEFQYKDFKEYLDKQTEMIGILAFKARKQREKPLKNKYERKMFNLNSLNWAIYCYITDTTEIIGENFIFHKEPFKYSKADPYGSYKWENTQILHLLSNENGEGNCYSLAVLFKIFSNRLNSDARLVTTPHHIYIQNRNERGDFKNIELATEAFPGDGSIQVLTYTTKTAIMNGMAQQPLNDKQAVALNLIYLAKGFQHKFSDNTNDFLLKCAELAIKHDSLSLNALLLKAEVTESKLFRQMLENNISTPILARKNASTKSFFRNYEEQLSNLYKCGYREIPKDIQKVIFSAVQGNQDKYLTTDKTPNPFAEFGETTRYATLSWGVFDEVHDQVDTVNYFHSKMSTKSNGIIAFDLNDSMVIYKVDPVIFALSIDPLAAKYAYYSPYSAFANSPIWYKDEDGRENIVYLVYLPNKDSKITKADAQQMANQANENYKKMGLNTRVVFVDKSISGGKEFDPNKIDEHDAVAVIGTTGDVTNYIKSKGGDDAGYIEGWKGGAGSGGDEPERSENKYGYKGNRGGGKFIAVDANSVEGYGKGNGWTKAEAGAEIIQHGSGHNADLDANLQHAEAGGVMTSGGALKYELTSDQKKYSSITSPSNNTKFISHIKQRFGTQQATIKYNGQNKPVK